MPHEEIRVTALPFIVLGLAQAEQSGSSKPSQFAMAPFSPSQRLDITFHHTASLYVCLIPILTKRLHLSHRGARLKIIGKSASHSGSLLVVRGEV